MSPWRPVVNHPRPSRARRRPGRATGNGAGRFPHGKVTVSLAPADLKKAGPTYDLVTELGSDAVTRSRAWRGIGKTGRGRQESMEIGLTMAVSRGVERAELVQHAGRGHRSRPPGEVLAPPCNHAGAGRLWYRADPRRWAVEAARGRHGRPAGSGVDEQNDGVAVMVAVSAAGGDRAQHGWPPRTSVRERLSGHDKGTPMAEVR